MTDTLETIQVQSGNQETDFLIRSYWIWSLLYLSSLFIPTVISLLNPSLRPQVRVLALGLALLSTLWHWLWAHVLHRRTGFPQEKPLLVSVYVIGIFAIWYFLVGIDNVFYIHLAGAYSQIYIFFPPTWAISYSILVSLFLFWQQTDGDLENLNLEITLFWFLITATGIVFYLWVRGIIIQSEQRKRLIQQLKNTQAELAASERRAGVLSERQRLAQEIHDTLAQGFTSIVMHLEAAEQGLPTNADPKSDETAHKHLVQARQTARESLEQARRLVWELRPQPLESASLPEAIKRTGQKWTQDSGIPCEVNTTGQIVALHPQVEITLLRAVQEALNNVLKHAQAGEVCVTLSYFENLVVLDVQDNGQGFDLVTTSPRQTKQQNGYGLTAMRERVEKLDGKLLVESTPGEGTTLVIEIPLSG